MGELKDDARNEDGWKLAGRRAWRSGSVYRTKGQYWTANIPLAPGPHGERRRKEVRCATREEAERLVKSLSQNVEYVSVRTPISKPRGIEAIQAITAALQRAHDGGYDIDSTAVMVHAATRPSRLKYGVTGPCVYCGDDFASTVDHVDPAGGDGPENVVSACNHCNVSKGRRTPDQWRAA
jgi:5-methylcytosine-specific restriction endonuclease McrA